jgi:hypothetical protein
LNSGLITESAPPTDLILLLITSLCPIRFLDKARHFVANFSVLVFQMALMTPFYQL